MKTNEAPEKIYLFENPITETPDYRWLSKRSDENDIEYIRTDVFVKKVKEVDLDKEIKSYFKGFGKFASVGIDDCIDIAKHFFELGMRASNQLTWEDMKLIWTIGDDIPAMAEEDFYKELLKRFKAHKGE